MGSGQDGKETSHSKTQDEDQNLAPVLDRIMDLLVNRVEESGGRSHRPPRPSLPLSSPQQWQSAEGGCGYGLVPRCLGNGQIEVSKSGLGSESCAQEVSQRAKTNTLRK